MNTLANASTRFLLLAVWMTACGAGESEVQITLMEGMDLPCMGAAHMIVEVDLLQGSYRFDAYPPAGLYFFNLETFGCSVPMPIRFDRLAYSPQAKVVIKVMDSSNDLDSDTRRGLGVLADGVSPPFGISENSGSHKLEINLSRRPDAYKGTVMVYKPADWQNVQQGIATVMFQVHRKQADLTTVKVRDGYISYDRVLRSDPFPLLISNLSVTAPGETFTIRIDGLASDLTTIRYWSSEFYLEPDRIAFVNLPS